MKIVVFLFFRLSLCGKRLFDHRLLDGRLEYVLASCVTDYRGGLFLFIQQWTHFRSFARGNLCAFAAQYFCMLELKPMLLQAALALACCAYSYVKFRFSREVAKYILQTTIQKSMVKKPFSTQLKSKKRKTTVFMPFFGLWSFQARFHLTPLNANFKNNIPVDISLNKPEIKWEVL